ncbi:MAG: thioredoxin [Bacteroidia bacterium]|nr:thioredoxin [Bacteroidia bacterium]
MEKYVDFQQDVIERSKTVPVVVDFWAAWCGPCRVLGPVIEELASQADGRWELVKLDTELQKDIATRYKVMSIPAVKMFSQGEVIAEFVGALPAYQIERWLATHLPDPRTARLEELVQQATASRSDQDLFLLEAFMNLHPDLDQGHLALARLLLHRDPARAVELVSDLHEGHKLGEAAAHVRTLAEFMTFAGPPDSPVAAKVGAAREAYTAGDMDGTLKLLIEAVMADKAFHKELPRRAVLALFGQLGDQDPITRKHRPYFNMALY